MTVQLIQYCPSLQLLHDTEMNGYHRFNFTQKTFLRSIDPKQPKNVKFAL
jgi:hypothetical protein